MKVGIVTQYTHDNMGNKLQNYALQQILLRYAEEVVTLRSYPRAGTLKELLAQSPLGRSPGFCRLVGKHRKAAFLDFQKQWIEESSGIYCLDKTYQTLNRKDRCDLYCVGSDQVWKPGSRRAGVFHFLGFAPERDTFSYAASFGVSGIPRQYRERFREGLTHIRHLSLREPSGVRLTEDLTGRTDAQLHLDPTLMLTTQAWDLLASEPNQKIPGRYILTYFLGDILQRRKEAIRLEAARRGCSVINVMDKRDEFYSIGPEEFLFLVKHADMVCTDSYHGSIFTFLYRRPLAIFERKGTYREESDRMSHLTATLSLENAVAQGEEMPRGMKEQDYTAGHAALTRERSRTSAYLEAVFREWEERI